MKNFKIIVNVDDEINLCYPDIDMAAELFKTIDRQRNYLKRWLIWVDDNQSVEDSKKFLKMARVFNLGGQRFNTIIFYKGKIAGSVGFVKLDKPNRKGEIGYWLSEDLQGKGIITKSCKGLISFGFQQMNLNRIEIKLARENTKSEAIPVRLGFKHEGTLRQSRIINGQYYDSEIFGLLKKDWPPKIS